MPYLIHHTQEYLERERPNNRGYSNVVPGSVLIRLSDGTSITDLTNNSSDDRTSVQADLNRR
jgi:hypothetical protein